MSRELTTEEVRDKVLDYAWGCIDEWERILVEGRSDGTKITPRQAMAGAMFSFMAMLDGNAAWPEALPQFFVAPDPHPEDRAYAAKSGKDYWPENYTELAGDVGGTLHDSFYQRPGATGLEDRA